MSKILFDENSMIVNKTLAGAIGLNEAIVVQQVHYWIKINEGKNQNFYENKYWTYNSIKSWHENEFIFWSYDTVKRTFKSLEQKGILISGNFNREKWDKTKWYTINYDKLDEIYQSTDLKRTIDEGQDAPAGGGEMNQPIPETSTEITKENTTIQKHCENTMKNVPFEDIELLFNTICKSLPKIAGIKNNRKKVLTQRWRENPDIWAFKNLFERVEKSDFLSGRSNVWMGCCFDWIIKPSDFQKIIEGNYDNKEPAEKEQVSSQDFDFTNL